MLDIHSHVLFGVDDGPETVDVSIAMLRSASEQGITDIVVTPHAFHHTYHVSTDDIQKQVSLLSVIIGELNINLKLHTGQEIRLHEDLIENLYSGEALPLANSRYFLLEMPSYSIPIYSFTLIELAIKNGYIPIIAHPERNTAIMSDSHILLRMVELGAYAQVNAGSLLGRFGRKARRVAIQLIRKNLIHCYGSDTHNVTTRPNDFANGLAVLEKRNLADVVDNFLSNNQRILRNEPILVSGDRQNPVTKCCWNLRYRNWMKSRGGVL